MQLLLNFYVERPLFEQESLDALHDLIARYLPAWGKRLRVSRDEESEDARELRPGESLYQVASEATPVKFGLSSIVVSGSHDRVLLLVDGCRSTLPPELNSFSVEIVDGTVEGRPAAEWANDFFVAATGRLPVRYANIHLDEEFRAKNIIKTAQVEKAIGVQLDVALPGLYWLNYFGPPYVKLIGMEKLLSASAYQCQTVAEGVLIRLSENPEEWDSQTYRERERQVIAHLGERFFFPKDDPNRATVAPDFRSELTSRSR